VWTIPITTLWVAHGWDVNGGFERLGHERDRGEWNATLSALRVGVLSTPS
jgi:hypothetical protein